MSQRLPYFLVFSERESLGLDAIFGDDVKLHLIAGVDVALGSGNEDVFHQIHGFFLGQRSFLHILHVFEADLNIGDGSGG